MSTVSSDLGLCLIATTWLMVVSAGTGDSWVSAFSGLLWGASFVLSLLDAFDHPETP